MDEFKPRISDTTAGLMIGTAFFFYTLQIVLAFIFMGWLVVIFAYLTFWLWYKLHDVGFLERFGAKKAVAYIIMPILSFFSLGTIPGIVISVFTTIAIVKFEDKLMKKGIVSRDDLKKLEKFVMDMGSTHGFDSPEFNHALASSLGRNIEERYESKRAEVKDRFVAKVTPISLYKGGQGMVNYSDRTLKNKAVEKDEAA